MNLDPDSCYRALATHDTRFDGRFFVGVTSTHIYCRPVCTVRTPRRENCRFFMSAAAAEVEGFRPCMRCRPELAPGMASVDATARLAQGAVDLIENGTLEEGGIDHLAARVGVTPRHLRRVFAAEFGVAPVEYAQTQRLLLAKRLLTDTALPVTEIALASGFQSVRRFNALFKSRYRMAPGRLRRDRAPGMLPDALRFELAFRPPYAFDAILDFLRDRAIPGIENVGAHAYTRTLTITHRGTMHTGVIDVRRLPRKSALAVQLSASFARVVPQALARVKHAFDLACDPNEIDAHLGPLAVAHPGLRVPGAFDGFELGVRAIVGQQVSVRAARTLLGRVVRTHGEALEGAMAAATVENAYRFPTATAIAVAGAAAVAQCGLTPARARTIVALAEAVAAGGLVLEPGVDVEATIERLRALPGVGPWTAHYIAMRALRWPDAFLANDLVVLRAMNETRPARAEAASAAWRPWRAYAVMHLWKGAST
ncbi:MAG TPA: AlkA N-terminal domain-containing protein [Casimicrobiaceae bacterium]|nr:AlkA N-terminal domain-containing protein [Casimicrobiaceae bacterium]